MHQPAVATIVSMSMLAHARVLARSLHVRHPEVHLYVLVADDRQGAGAAELGLETSGPVTVLGLDDLSIPDLARFCFWHDAQQASYAATPYVLQRVLDGDHDGALFLKQESLVVGSLEPILDLVTRRSLVLTPHLLEPLVGPDAAERELTILQSGTFNGGVVGVGATSQGREFLAWWAARTYRDCRRDLDAGLHFEQRWLDHAPVLVDDLEIVRDPGANVGHWSLPERDVQVHGEQVLVDGAECGVFRSSGFDALNPARVTCYSTRLSMESIGGAATLFEHMAQLLEDAGHRGQVARPYAWDCFDDGVRIPAVAREMYRELADPDRFDDPFTTGGERPFRDWLMADAGTDPAAPGVPRLWLEVHRRRDDVQQAFPDPLGVSREPFLQWIAEHGVVEHDIDPALAPSTSGVR